MYSLMGKLLFKSGRYTLYGIKYILQQRFEAGGSLQFLYGDGGGCFQQYEFVQVLPYIIAGTFADKHLAFVIQYYIIEVSFFYDEFFWTLREAGQQSAAGVPHIFFDRGHCGQSGCCGLHIEAPKSIMLWL